jgi:hypothetical protein
MSKRFKSTLAGRTNLKSTLDSLEVPEPTIPAIRENGKVSERAYRAKQTPVDSLRSQNLNPLNPTTGQRGPSSAELEFIKALEDYKQMSGHLYPTWSEVLEVLRKLGYAPAGKDRPDFLGRS